MSSVQVPPILLPLGLAGCLRWPKHLGCFAITTVFSHAQTVVLCGACSSVLCQPTGGKARLTEGSSPPCSRILQVSYISSQAVRTVERTRSTVFRVSELSYCIVSHAHYLVFLVANVNESSPIGVPSTSYSKDIQNTAESELKSAPHLFRLLWWEYPGSYNPFLREVCNESSILGEYL